MIHLAGRALHYDKNAQRPASLTQWQSLQQTGVMKGNSYGELALETPDRTDGSLIVLSTSCFDCYQSRIFPFIHSLSETPNESYVVRTFLALDAMRRLNALF